MDEHEVFSALRRVFNITEFNRGKLGEAVRAHEASDHGNWFFVQTSRGVTSAIIPFKELEGLVAAKEALERILNAFLYQEASGRLGAATQKVDFSEAMRKLGIDPSEIASLVELVEFE